MVDFSNLLSEESKRHLAETQREVHRLHGLPDRWLAETLLNWAREIREFDPGNYGPDRMGNPHDATYAPNFLWHMVPEVCRRLADVELRPNEATRPGFTGMDAQGLREMAGVYLENVHEGDLAADPHGTTVEPGVLLAHDVQNGNPLAFAVDRVAPALEDPPKPDRIANLVLEVSRARGYEPTPYWSPEIDGPLRHAELLPEADGEADNVVALKP